MTTPALDITPRIDALARATVANRAYRKCLHEECRRTNLAVREAITGRDRRRVVIRPLAAPRVEMPTQPTAGPFQDLARATRRATLAHVDAVLVALLAEGWESAAVAKARERMAGLLK